MERCHMTYLTSRGVPARLRILTIACTPPEASKARSAPGESTKIHKSVSRTMDVRGEGAGVRLELELWVVGDIDDR